MKKKHKTLRDKSLEELIQEHVAAAEAYDKASEACDKALDVSAKAHRVWQEAASALKKRLAL